MGARGPNQRGGPGDGIPQMERRSRTSLPAREGGLGQVSVLATTPQATAVGAKTEAQLRNVRTTPLGLGWTCSKPQRHFGDTISDGPRPQRPTRCSRQAASQAGKPGIQARGGMMMLAGTCRSKIGSARSDAPSSNSVGRRMPERAPTKSVRSTEDGRCRDHLHSCRLRPGRRGPSSQSETGRRPLTCARDPTAAPHRSGEGPPTLTWC